MQNPHSLLGCFMIGTNCSHKLILTTQICSQNNFGQWWWKCHMLNFATQLLSCFDDDSGGWWLCEKLPMESPGRWRQGLPNKWQLKGIGRMMMMMIADCCQLWWLYGGGSSSSGSQLPSNEILRNGLNKEHSQKKLRDYLGIMSCS